MAIRKWLFATTMLMLPLAAEAQAPQQPVLGIYLGAAGGFNIQTSQAVNNIMTNLPGAAGLAAPNTSVSTGIGAAAVGTVGYGLGNGFRVEPEGDYRSIRRAQAVAGELVRDGVPQNVITAQGFGDTHLLVSTGPGVREPQNRRVEIIVR